MLNNFIFARKKSLFTSELEKGNILDEAIVFIEDTKEIWNHGTYFDCSSVDLSGYHTKEEIAAELSNYITTSDLSNAMSGITGQINNLSSNLNDGLDTANQNAESARNLAQSVQDSLVNYATQSYVNTQISNLVDSAPETLNTLNELATAITEHQGVTDLLDSAISNKADKSELETKADKDSVYSIEEIDSMFVLPKYEFVDLGLPSGLKWATCNVGAEKPEEYGLYFAWGEIEGYEGITDEKQFSWSDYKLCNGSSSALTKYNTNSSIGTVDNLTTLEQVNDAAYVSDNTCRMPTSDDFTELLNNTTSTWETLNGVNGRRFTSKTNGNSIFVPAAGYCNMGSVSNVGSYGNVWSSSLHEGNNKYGRYLDFYSGNTKLDNNFRRNGRSVRAVQEPTTNTKFDPSEVYSRLNNLEATIEDINTILESIINS